MWRYRNKKSRVQLKDGPPVEGFVTSRGDFYTVEAASIVVADSDPIRTDGVILIPKSNVVYVQIGVA